MKTDDLDLVFCELAETNITGVDSFSPFCLKVIRALRAAGLSYVSRRAHDPGGFTSLNPTGQVPILLVEGKAITDSTRILRTIRELSPGVFPGEREPRARGESHLWEELADTHLNGFLVASRWADPSNWPSVKQAYFGGAPWFVRALIAPRIRANVTKNLVARDVWRAGPDACWAAFEVTLDALEARAPSRGFWLAEGFSAADVALSAQLESLRTPLTPRQATLVGARSKLSSWLDRVDAATRATAFRPAVSAPAQRPERVFVDPGLRAEC